MALINQISNLRLLKYSTSPRGKYSGYNPNPLTQEYIPFKFEGIESNSIDFLYRGGDKTDGFIKRDEKRFGRFLKTINGNLFLFKQHSLSRQGVPTAAGTLESQPIREYSQDTTKAAIRGIGESIFYDGKGDNKDIPFDAKYAYLYKNTPLEDNVLINLYNNKQIINSSGNNEMFSYISGPGSDFGEGKTIISFTDQRTGVNNPLRSKYPVYFSRGGVKLHESEEFNINKTLGVSKVEEFKPTVTGFNTNGSQNKIFGPRDKNTTPSRDENLKKQLETQNNTLGLQMYKTSPTNLTSSLGVSNLIQSKIDSSFPSDSDLGTGLSNQGTTTTNFGFNTLPVNTGVVLYNLGKDYLAFRSNSPTNFSTYVGEIKLTNNNYNLTSLSSKLGLGFGIPLTPNQDRSVYDKEQLKNDLFKNDGRIIVC